MKKFIVSFVFILAGLFVIDRLGGMAMWWINQHTCDVSGPKMKYLVYNVHEDVVLMGTSRCNLHYVPSIISDTIKMSVYNGGIDASNNIYAHYIMLNHVLARHLPKVICLDVMASDFVESEDPFRTVTFFAPYFGLNERADSVFREAGKYWQYHVSHLYRYNAKATSNIAGMIINRQNGSDNGYIPVPKPSSFPNTLKKEEPLRPIDPLKMKYLQRFINLCKKNGIKLIFIVSPLYAIAEPTRYDTIKALAKESGIPVLDYHTTGLYHDHPEYFKDEAHLWDEGAKLYSSVFASDLKNLLQNPDVPSHPRNLGL